MDTKNSNFIDNFIARLRLSQIVDYVNDDDKILDFGCGAKSFLLSSMGKKIKLGVGLDYDVENNSQGNVKYVNYKFNGKLPFDGESFDKVFLLAVLEHIKIDQVDKLFSEFERILKSGGKVILTTPTPKSKPLLEFLALKLHLISSSEILDHQKYYNKDMVIRLATKTGLKIKKYNLFQFGLNSCSVLEKR